MLQRISVGHRTRAIKVTSMPTSSSLRNASRYIRGNFVAVSISGENWRGNRSQTDRVYIAEFSSRRQRGGAITPGITTWKTFHPPPAANPRNGDPRDRERERERERERGRGHRRGANAEDSEKEWQSRLAPLSPRDVVKYVAIYTGDWRHWRLGSKRAPSALRWRYPLAYRISLCALLSPAAPPILIPSPVNPCAGGSGLPDQKSIREIPVPA